MLFLGFLKLIVLDVLHACTKPAEKCEAKPESGLKARGEQLVLKLYLMRPVASLFTAAAGGEALLRSAF